MVKSILCVNVNVTINTTYDADAVSEQILLLTTSRNSNGFVSF